MKRLIAILMCILLLGGIVTGCNAPAIDEPSETEDINEDISDLIKIVWAVHGDLSNSVNLDYFNSLLRQKGYPYKVELFDIYDEKTGGNFEANLRKAKENNTQIDILNSEHGLLGANGETVLPMKTYIDGGYCIKLDKYADTEEFKKLVEIYTPRIMEASKIDGAYYHIPILNFGPYMGILYWDKELAKKYNLDMTKVQEDFSLLAEYADIVNEGEKGNSDFIISKDNNLTNLWLSGINWLQHYNFTYLDCSEDIPRVEFIFDREDISLLTKTVADMYEKGYITDGGSNYKKSFVGMIGSSSEKEFEEVYNADGEYDHFVRSRQMLSNQCSMYGNAIASWSEHQDDAFKLLAAVMSDPDLNNALVFGEEGKNYYVENGRCYVGEDLEAYPNYAFKNKFISYPAFSESANKETLYEAYDQMELSPIMGFCFDETPVKKECTDVYNILNQGNVDLLYWNDPEEKSDISYHELLEQIIQQMRDAGVYTVIDEMNRQIEEWWSNNKQAD